MDKKKEKKKKNKEREKPSGFTLLSDYTSKQTLIKFAHPQKHLIISSQALFLVGLGARIRNLPLDLFMTELNKNRTENMQSGGGESSHRLLAKTFIEHWSRHCITQAQYLNVFFSNETPICHTVVPSLPRPLHLP